MRKYYMECNGVALPVWLVIFLVGSSLFGWVMLLQMLCVRWKRSKRVGNVVKTRRPSALALLNDAKVAGIQRPRKSPFQKNSPDKMMMQRDSIATERIHKMTQQNVKPDVWWAEKIFYRTGSGNHVQEMMTPTLDEKQKMERTSECARVQSELNAQEENNKKRNLANKKQDQVIFKCGDEFAQVFEINLNQVSLMKLLATSPQCEVYCAIWRDTDVAVKLLVPQDGTSGKIEESAANFRREIYIMSTLHHTNVVSLIGANLSPSCYILVMEFMHNGSLYDYIRDTSNEFNGKMVLLSCLGIARGMAYLHENNIIQRDLKSNNLLMSQHLIVKIADFGCSRFTAQTNHHYTFVGTPFWAAPEVILNESYDEKADVYSYAIVLWELFMRKDPYDTKDSILVPLKVAKEGLRPSIPSPSERVPQHLIDAMIQCWDPNPANRPSFQVLIHQFNNARHERRLSTQPTLFQHVESVSRGKSLSHIIKK